SNTNRYNKIFMEEVIIHMNTAKKRLLEIIDEIPEQEVDKILDFAEYLKVKKDKSVTEDLTKASESSLSFWDNDIDDEVWNNVYTKQDDIVIIPVPFRELKQHKQRPVLIISIDSYNQLTEDIVVHTFKEISENNERRL